MHSSAVCVGGQSLKRSGLSVIPRAWTSRLHRRRALSTHATLSQARCIDAPSVAKDALLRSPIASHGKRDSVKEKLRMHDVIVPPPSSFLTDRFSRQHTYLRISLTEKCNFRCLYCMPAEGVPLTPKEHLLTATEVERVARLFVQEGVQKIRLTGGEPTIRKDLPEIISALSNLRSQGLRQIGMTTNGLTLSRQLPHLVANGLTHLNVSLDTLDPFKFEFMTRTAAKGIDKVLDSIDTALALGVQNVKVNVVVIRGLNDGQDVLDFVDWAKERDVTIRFIEYMPFDGNRWRPEKLVPYSDLLQSITKRFGTLDKVVDDANDTSKHWRVPGHRSRIGFITSMTEHFCGTCNRLRVTADGNLKVCLFGNAEVSLRDAMRTGLPEYGDRPASDDDLLHIIGAAVQRKHARHAGMKDPVELAKERTKSPRLRKRSLNSTSFMLARSPSTFLSTPSITFPAVIVRSYSTGKVSVAQADRSSNREERTLNKENASGSTQSWSAYMGIEGEDSPWASLDAIVDGLNKTSSEANTLPTGSSEARHLREETTSSHNAFEEAAVAAAEAFASAHTLDNRTSAQSSHHTSPFPPQVLTHLDPEDNSRAAMVDVSDKPASKRSATATCRVHIPDAVLHLLDPTTAGNDEAHVRRKGPVLHTAQLAGIMAAKRTSELIPLCHGLHLSKVDVDLEVIRDGVEGDAKLPHFIRVTCTATTTSSTGVEMEALTGASVASLTLWDMLKSVAGTTMRIDGLVVMHKQGGKSGDFVRMSE